MVRLYARRLLFAPRTRHTDTNHKRL